ncbi:MAG: histidine kinase N-terminal 7TM domain-containing protein [Candidatus Methylumidiphilus sp.]
MHLKILYYALALLFCACSASAVAVYVWRRCRSRAVARRFTLFAALVAVWLLLHAAETLSDETAPRLLISLVRWVFAMFIATAYLAVALDFAGLEQWLSRRRLALLLAPPCAWAVLILSHHWHGCCISDYRLVDAGFRTVENFTPKLGYWLFMLYLYCQILLAQVVLLWSMRQGAPVYRRQALLLVLACAVPTATDIVSQAYRLYWFGGVRLTPFTSLVLLCLTGWALFRHHLFDITPVARAATVESLSDGVLVIDADGRIADLNPAARLLLDLGEDALGQPARQRFAVWPALGDGLAGGVARQICFATQAPCPRMLDARISPLHDRRGRRCGLVLLLRDVTAQKQAEERYRRLLDSNPLAMTVIEIPSGVIVYANQKAADLAEMPLDGLIGSAALERYADPADRVRIMALIAEKGQIADYEVCLKSTSGRLAWCLVTSSPTQFDGKYCHVSSIMDITGRKQAEAALQAKAQTEAAERQQRAILDNLPVGVVLSGGPEHRLLYLNPRFVEMFGYAAEDLPDVAHWWPLAYPDPVYRQQVLAEWGRRMALGRAGQTTFAPLEVTITTRDGAAKYVGAHTAVVGDLTFSTFIDLTERQQAEAARRERDAAEAANHAKSRFLANMSHEIRTPLNAVLGFAQVLARDPALNAEQRGKLAVIQRNGEHLLELIGGILDLAKVESGRMSLDARPFNLHRLLADVETLFRPRAQEQGLAFTVDTAGLPRFVEGDGMKLRQVLINLLSNAVKFTRHGAVELCAEGLDGGAVRFSVADTGAGIAEEEMGRLFEPFSQTASGLHLGGGTGLGLALSRQFVRLMGGELKAQSRPGVGSRFFFTLHLRLAEAPGLPPQHLPAQAKLAAGQPLRRILIVDDLADNREPLRQLLDSANPDPPVLAFREAADGREALAVWEDWQPHLVFMDMRMPALSGEEAARRIKALRTERPLAAQSIVVALSASAFAEDRQRFLALGCDEFACKPFQAEALFALLQRRLGLRFESVPTADSAPDLPQAALAARLAACPLEWRSALCAAADRGDFAKVDALIGQIQPHDAGLHRALAKWAEACDHEALSGLLGVPD